MSVLRMDDCDWTPPSAAEMEIMKQKRKRSDRVSALMGQYMLKGYRMVLIFLYVINYGIFSTKNNSKFYFSWTNIAQFALQSCFKRHRLKEGQIIASAASM